MYPLTIELVDFLLSDRARAALDELMHADLSDIAILPGLTELRRNFTPSEASVLIDQARLRQRASLKFPNSDRLFFTDEALQQASSFGIARFRAERFAKYRRVADLGSGIGADTLALAEVVPELTAIECNSVLARLLTANVTAMGLTSRVRVVCADWTQLSLNIEAAFVDPSRRVGGRRVFRLDEMNPSLSSIMALFTQVPDVAVKVAPSVVDDEIPPDVEVEFVSEQGECKEALLLFGGMRRGVARTATLLPGAHRLDSTAPITNIPTSVPQEFLYEPDVAILRATLVRALATQLNAAQLDASIAYITSNTLVSTPFARVWNVIKHSSFHLKTLNKWLREMEAGEVIVKKRGSPIEPETFQHRLKITPGGPTITVFLTRMCGRPWMIIGREIK